VIPLSRRGMVLNDSGLRVPIYV